MAKTEVMLQGGFMSINGEAGKSTRVPQVALQQHLPLSSMLLIPPAGSQQVPLQRQPFEVLL